MKLANCLRAEDNCGEVEDVGYIWRFVCYNCARCVRFRRERRVMRKKEKGRENLGLESLEK